MMPARDLCIRLMQPADDGRIGEICRAIYLQETPHTPVEPASAEDAGDCL